MKFLFLLASVTVLFFAATLTNAYYLPQPELAPELQFLLDSLVQVSFDQSVQGDERIEQMRALVLPFFIYADVDQDGFVTKKEFKAFVQKVMPYLLSKLLASLPPNVRLQVQQHLSDYYSQMVDESFAELDANGNGRVSLQEALNSIH